MSTPTQWCCRCTAHRSEVCGLKWSPDNRQLASGGNDNQLCIWDLQNSQPSMKFGEHSAAVKAIAWSPHQHGLLASGGGTADRCIRFWNTATQAKLNTIDTGSQVRSIWYCIVCACVDKLVEPRACVHGVCARSVQARATAHATCSTHKVAEDASFHSMHGHSQRANAAGCQLQRAQSINKAVRMQVCNLAWSKNVNEIVSTHGYSQNQIIVWKYPTMNKLATLTGHTLRVLYLAMSPDGQTIVTGAGDETLRFWNVFPGPKASTANARNTSSVATHMRTHIR